MNPNTAGPPLARLLHRLTETPVDFLDSPCVQGEGYVHCPALVFDLSRAIGQPCTLAELNALPDRQEDGNWLSLIAIACWLLDDEVWAGCIDKAGLLRFLQEALKPLAEISTAEIWLDDPERREEFARLALACLGLCPQGETPAQAQDRLTAISSIERQRILAETRATEARARAIRERLAREEAARSADKAMRE
jgi:hypothetical protein